MRAPLMSTCETLIAIATDDTRKYFDTAEKPIQG
jgi:hypothetical protein